MSRRTFKALVKELLHRCRYTETSHFVYASPTEAELKATIDQLAREFGETSERISDAIEAMRMLGKVQIALTDA